MSPQPSDRHRELLRLYQLAAPGERNLEAHLRGHPDVVQQLGVVLDLDQDDAELALQLAPSIGRYKRRSAAAREEERRRRSEQAADALSRSARHVFERIDLDERLVLGEVLAGDHEYISFDSTAGRVPVLRRVLLRARVPLRAFLDLACFVDAAGLHFVWRGGHGGLNLRPRPEERGASVLHVDLAKRLARRATPAPTLLADVLHDLGLI